MVLMNVPLKLRWDGKLQKKTSVLFLPQLNTEACIKNGIIWSKNLVLAGTSVESLILDKGNMKIRFSICPLL